MPAAADPRGVGAALRVTPNLLTLARLAAVPAIVSLILAGRPHLALIGFVAAGATDALDGWLARRWGAGTALGAVLDPLADKALLMSVYAALALVGVLPVWLAALVAARDLGILGGIAWLALRRRTPSFRPLPISRLNTAVQVGVAALALALAERDPPATAILAAAAALVAVTTILSGGAYARAAWRGGQG